MKLSSFKSLKLNSFKSAYPPPPPPPQWAPPRKGINKGLLAGVLIAIILVAALVPLFAFNIIPWRSESTAISPTQHPTTSPSPSPTTGTLSTSTYGLLIGTVVDTYGNSLADANVVIGGKTGTTNGQGWFSVAGVTPGNSQIAKFSKSGYVTTYLVTQIQEGQSSSVQATLKAVDVTQTISATQGGTIITSDGYSALTILANTLETQQGTPYTGTATFSLTAFDPSNQYEAQAFPGEYLGITTSQTTVPIQSFGFINIQAVDQNGQELELATGKTAPLTVYVPYDLQTDAQALGTCPLWYFDSSNGMWQEQGQGTYDTTSGCFNGSISHFSTWNFDFAYKSAYVSGTVVDTNGNPIQGALVKCWASGWMQQSWTNQAGGFNRIPVQAGVTFQYQAFKSGHQSNILTAGPLPAGNETYIGQIVLASPVVTITLTWGLDPRDLDSHLTANLEGGTTFHVWYDDMGSLTAAPFASLDTDDTHSYGPEIISISQLQPGTYQYSVRHFAGDGNISTSGAQVTLIGTVQGQSFVKSYTPPASQPQGTDIWRIFTISVDSTGKITAIHDINDYVTGDDTSNFLYPS